MIQLEIAKLDDLSNAFAELGTHVGPRVGADSRTQEQKEWWCFRRYVFTLAAIDQLAFPASIAKSERPDFRCKFGLREAGVEVTEATHPSDQRELTLIDRQQATVLRGSLGGRFPNGAAGDEPERIWQEDVVKAVASKARKIPTWPAPMSEYSLLLYTNSNAGSLIFDWPRAFKKLDSTNGQIWKELVGTRVVTVSVICDQWLLVLKPDDVSWHPLEGDENVDELRRTGTKPEG